MSTGVDCLVYVNGDRLPDGSPADNPLDPTALSGLAITWGRSTTVDQPAASTCEFDVADDLGGRAFLELLRTGNTVSVISSGQSFPDPTLPTVVDPSFEGAAVGSAVSARVINTSVRVVDEMAATGAHSARLQAPTASSTSPSSAVFPPAPFDPSPAAWDDIPTTEPGQTWRVGATVRARAGAQIIVQAVSFSRPDGSYSLIPGTVVSVPATGGWQQLAATVVPPASGAWLGVSVTIGSTGRRWVDATGSWADAADDTPGAPRAAAVRTNLATDPRAALSPPGSPATATSLGWWRRWYGGSGAGTAVTVLGASDGPTAQLTSYQRVTWTTSPTNNAEIGFNHSRSASSSQAASTNDYPVTPGQVWSFSSWLRKSGGALLSVGLRFYFRDAAGLLIGGQVAGPKISLQAGVWTLCTATVTVPDAAVYMGVATFSDGSTVVPLPGDTLDGTGLLAELAPTVGTYFDGSTPDQAPTNVPGTDNAWTGAVNASPSTQTILPPLYRANLLTNPSAESLTGWLAWGAATTMTLDTTQKHSGASSARVVSNGAAAHDGAQVSVATSAPLGGVHSSGVWVLAPAGAALYTQLRYNNQAAQAKQTNFTATGAWQWVTVDGWAAPAAVTSAAVQVRTATPQAITFYVDDALLERAPTVGTYFDGNTPDVPATTMTEGVDYAWTGAVNASTSTATVVPQLPVIGPPWLDYAAAHVDDLLVLEPAAGTIRTVSVFEGRITDLVAAFDESVGGVVVHVTAADFTVDLENVAVGDEPWPVESMAARFERIVALAGLPVETIIDPGVGSLLVSYVDVDSQPTTSLLKDLAQSVDGILWPAVHQVTGAYLWVEDPGARPSMYMLALVDGLVTVVPVSGDDALSLSACDILRDPVDWVQNVSDVSTRAAVAWLEQVVDDDGLPDTIEHTYTAIDAPLERDYGVRRIQLSTLLQAEADAQTIAARLLARSSLTDWRAGGITIDDDDSLEAGPAAAGTLLTLLDGTSRIGLPIRLTDLPAWSPRTPDVPVYLEGGSYAYIDGAWTLALTISPASMQGESATWVELPTAWRWVDVDPALSWTDVTGVGAPTATERELRP